MTSLYDISNTYFLPPVKTLASFRVFHTWLSAAETTPTPHPPPSPVKPELCLLFTDSSVVPSVLYCKARKVSARQNVQQLSLLCIVSNVASIHDFVHFVNH